MRRCALQASQISSRFVGHGYFILRNERQLYGDSESQSYPAVFPSYANSFYPSQLRPTSRRQVERKSSVANERVAELLLR